MSEMSKPVVQELTGSRLHLHHGPIDIVLKAWGHPGDVRASYGAVVRRFSTILDECVSDLRELRRPFDEAPRPTSSVGLRMTAACSPFTGDFITPMAAVAGAVADELMAAMTSAARLSRAYVNNGGDIAVHVTDGHSLSLGVAGDFASSEVPRANGLIRIAAGSAVGGVATSGSHGRSFSRGIADSVTVLARSAALADAAATMIANAVDIESPLITRRRACDLDPDSDLGNLLVTTGVGRLSGAQVEAALTNGVRRAESLLARSVIAGASLMLQGAVEIVGGGAGLMQTPLEKGVPA